MFGNFLAVYDWRYYVRVVLNVSFRRVHVRVGVDKHGRVVDRDALRPVSRLRHPELSPGVRRECPAHSATMHSESVGPFACVTCTG